MGGGGNVLQEFLTLTKKRFHKSVPDKGGRTWGVLASKGEEITIYGLY